MFAYLFEAITKMLTINMGFFDSLGRTTFISLATILVAWYGIRLALSGMQENTFSNFASFILMLSFGYAMVFYYNTPLPGIGRSFHKLITDEAQYLTDQITVTQVQAIIDRLTLFETQIEQPSLANIVGTIVYGIIILLVAAAQAVAFVVVAWGLVAVAVCVLLGPVFIPFFIIPQLDWLFWGWLKAFLQFAFYEVVAAAVVYVIGNLLISELNLLQPGYMSLTQLSGLFPALAITFLASIYALLKIPDLTSAIFSGSAGGSSAGILGLIAGRFMR
jgi:hypothetical protein